MHFRPRLPSFLADFPSPAKTQLKSENKGKTGLKVLTNEKRGGLKVAEFDRSPFKLFTLKFSNKSVQSPSCERHKTA
jgi:hypothetical protein